MYDALSIAPTVTDLLADTQAERTTTGRAVEESLARLGAGEGAVHAWVVLSDRALQDAEAVDRQHADLPLRGLPIGVKDIIDVAGLPTRCGSESTTSPAAAEVSAHCVRRFQELGAVVIGKTVTTEYGYFAPGPTDNPSAPGHTPGGSSSGSAAAVAAGMVPLALGTQTAGSLTRPASYCGVTGMVLAEGTADMSGITGLSESLDSLGLLTPTVADMALVFEAFTGTRVRDRADDEIPVLVWRPQTSEPLDPVMLRAVELAEARLVATGRTVRPLEWDDHVRNLLGAHPVIMAYEAARQRSALLRRPGNISAPLLDLLAAGVATPTDVYQEALMRRDVSRTDLDVLLGGGGVIVGPAALGPAPTGLGATGSPILSRPWQALGLPVIAVPGIRTSDGLPLGLQVIGLPGREADLFAVAGMLEGLVAGLVAA